MSRMRVGRPTAFRCASTRVGVLPRAEPELAREAERAGHADRDALAVNEARRIVVGQALEGMAEGVAEIEQRAFALLGLVGDDERAPWRRNSSRSPRPAPGRPKTPRASGPPGIEEIPVADQAVFDHFGVAGAKLALAQRVEAPESARTSDG